LIVRHPVTICIRRFQRAAISADPVAQIALVGAAVPVVWHSIPIGIASLLGAAIQAYITALLGTFIQRTNNPIPIGICCSFHGDRAAVITQPGTLVPQLGAGVLGIDDPIPIRISRRWQRAAVPSQTVALVPLIGALVMIIRKTIVILVGGLFKLKRGAIDPYRISRDRCVCYGTFGIFIIDPDSEHPGAAQRRDPPKRIHHPGA